MATYTELLNLFNDSAIEPRVHVATVIAAYDLLTGTPTAADRAWAASVLSSPREEGKKAWRAILAANAATPRATILAVSDATLQTQVDAVVPQLVTAFSGA